MLPILAHAGEAHDTATEAATHSTLTDWYVALPLFIIFLFGAVSITYLVSQKSKSITSGVTLGLLFIAGVGFYKTSAVISVIALSCGFALALLLVIIGLSKPSRHR